MLKQKIHIVSLDVPYPADYGGAVDIFYRLKALYELGFDITLHMFEYGRGQQSELNKYAKPIYYSRKKSVFHLFSKRPFIVQSRRSNKLLKNLLKDDSPILFEGIHTTWFLENKQIQKRLSFVRTHNVEHEYYSGLKQNTTFFKGLFFKLEANKLKKYQNILSTCTHVLAIKEEDAAYIKQFNPNTHLLPASIPDISGKFTKVKRYSLFHGNLSVPENEAAAIWIINVLKNVIDPTFPLIIAGKNPGIKLQNICQKEKITLIANPSEIEIFDLIQEAQIHVLYTSVPSGIKLKLLSCIHSSGLILLNENMVKGSGLEGFCTIAKNEKEFKIDYIGLQNSVLSEEEFQKRSMFIQKHFNNIENCKIIQSLILQEND